MSEATKAMMVEAAAKAMIAGMFAPHELPVADDLWELYLKTARVALAAAAKEGWQPIETATREEGKPVLVWDGHWMAVAVPFSDKSWMIENSFGFNEDGEIWGVTHWQPLPEEPPK